MEKNSYRRTTCRLCLGKKLTQVLKLTPIPLPDEYVPKPKLKILQPAYPLNLVLCRDCGNVQLSHVVDPKIIYRNYIYETVSSMGLVEHFRKYADEVIQRTRPAKGTLVVDIGSNDGTLLRAFKDRGMKVLGIDPAKDIARAATESGIETLPEYFPQSAEKIVNTYGQAGIITVNNLFANVDDLDNFMTGVKKLIAPDGVLVIESYYLPDLINHMVFDFIYHEHLTSFTAGALQKFFDRHDMQLYDTMHVPTKGGSLRYFIQMKNGPRLTSKELASFIRLEKNMGVRKPSLYKQFDKKIRTAKDRTLKVLNGLKKKHQTIVGYGASATSTTLIYHFGLGKKLSYLIDEYKRKQDTFSPGLHIPVYSPEEIKKKWPAAIVILAWRYADPIINKNREYLANGGMFIVPLPKIRIVKRLS